MSNRQSARNHRLWFVIGVLALVLWAAWWGQSWRRNALVHVEKTWIMGWQFLGLDFLNNYQASRHWLAGGNVYQEPFGDPLDRTFCYPPLVLPTFAWCHLSPAQRAFHVFLLALTAITALAVWCAARTRRELGSQAVPFTVLLAAVLFSTPILYAFERGNFDLLVVPPVLLAAWALRGRGWLRDGLAGLCLAFAAGLKIYPLLLVLGLIPLRRPRAFILCGVAGVLLLWFHPGDYAGFRANAATLVAQNDPRITRFLGWTMHSLTATWPLLVEPFALKPLTRLPGLVAAALIFGPILLWTSRRICRMAEPRRVLLPYLLWLASLASFFPPVANDYSLVFLPLAVVMTWDRRDPVLVHLAMGLLLLSWQPYQLEVGPRVLMFGKVAAIWAVGISIVYRVREQEQSTEQVPTSELVNSLPRAA
ncbi:hypothetical protein BH10PLA2_BH10PLA2_38760 [soil metagenome]